MTTGTASWTTHLLALMTTGGDVRPGAGALPGISHPHGRPGAIAAAAVALAGCRRGSRNLRDASSPRQATTSGRGHSATGQISQGG